MFSEEIKAKLKENIVKLSKETLPVCNYLTDNPEISGEEEKSSKYVADFLRKQGYQVTENYKDVKYSFKAEMPNDKSLPKLAILCEYDALPDVGHACGHSISCGISLLAALALRETFADFPMQVDIIGTPAEEFGGGKILIADNGGFDGYKFAAMAHLFTENVPCFKILASCDMQVTFYGQSAHASAQPWDGKNALNAVQLFFHALDMMRQHMTPDCQMHGIISDGGVLPSIVPDKTVCYLYPRAGSMQNLNKLWDRMENCAKGATMATETTCKIEGLYDKYGDLYPTPTGKKLLNKIFDEQDMPYAEGEMTLGSSDIGNVDLLIPTFHPGIGIGDNLDIKLHSKEFAELMKTDDAVESLINGASVIANLCATLAFDEETLNQITKEHAKHRLS